jgi:seryl-tRNA synthetase
MTAVGHSRRSMLLNEFLKEHRTVEHLKQELGEERSAFQKALAVQQRKEEEQITALRVMLKEQATQIRKASDDLALRKATVNRVAIRFHNLAL